ncbi:hypothetical protein D3C80_1583720 [compost metagenome]
MEDRVHQQDRAQCRRTQHHRQQHQFQGAAVEAAEKLRPALEPHRVDEQCKEHRFEGLWHLNADLPDQQPHQQGAGHRSEVKAAQLNPTDEHAQGNRQEHRDFR